MFEVPFKENVDALVSKLATLITTKTIVGEPFTAGNATIIPIMSAGFGFGTGTGEGDHHGRGVGHGAGGGAGARISPVALVVLQDGDLKVYSLAQKGTLEKLAEIVPDVLGKLATHWRETAGKSGDGD